MVVYPIASDHSAVGRRAAGFGGSVWGKGSASAEKLGIKVGHPFGGRWIIGPMGVREEVAKRLERGGAA